MSGVRPCSSCSSKGYNDLHAADQVYVCQHDHRAQRKASAR